jgi:hypothetical protein
MTDGMLVYQVQCPLCGESIDLPHQSPLGIFSGLQNQPMGRWPITFLCKEHERLCQIQAPQGDPVQSAAGNVETGREVILYAVEWKCAHESCEKRVSIYTTDFAPANGEKIVDRLLRGLSKSSPPVRCPTGNHDLEWCKGEMSVTGFAP